MIEIILFFLGGIGVFIFWYERNEALKKEKKKQREYKPENHDKERQMALETEIEALSDRIIRDWNSAIFSDKIDTPGDGVVIYTFENGDTIHYQLDTLKYDTGTTRVVYTMGLLWRSQFTGIFNRIVEIINNRQAGTRRRVYTQTAQPESSDPKTRKYQVLQETIRLRKESLAKMRKNDPNRTALENELKAAERVASLMQK